MMDIVAVLALCLLVALLTAACVSRPEHKSQEQVQAELLLEEVGKEATAVARAGNNFDMRRLTTWRDPDTGNTHICSVEEALQRQNAADMKGEDGVDEFVTAYVDGLPEE